MWVISHHLIVFTASAPSFTPIIVDTGASTYVTPHCDDFLPDSYCPSTAIIKDLPGHNNVAGEGMVHWRMIDIHGQEVELVVWAYHILQASMHLLSPQCLIDQIGGEGQQFLDKVPLVLSNRITLDAKYGRANLPTLPAIHSSSAHSLWSQAFCFKALPANTPSTQWAFAPKSLLTPCNSNLTAAKQELLCWHYRLSHIGLTNIHNLTRHCCASANSDSTPITKSPLPCAHNIPRMSSTGLKCLGCTFA